MAFAKRFEINYEGGDIGKEGLELIAIVVNAIELGKSLATFELIKWLRWIAWIKNEEFAKHSACRKIEAYSNSHGRAYAHMQQY